MDPVDIEGLHTLGDSLGPMTHKRVSTCHMLPFKAKSRILLKGTRDQEKLALCFVLEISLEAGLGKCLRGPWFGSVCVCVSTSPKRIDGWETALSHRDKCPDHLLLIEYDIEDVKGHAANWNAIQSNHRNIERT